MTRKYILLVIALAAGVSGCLPASVQALRGEPGGESSFEIAAGYQEVYRRIAPELRTCSESAWIGDHTSVRAELFTDTRTAELSIEGVNMLLGRRVTLLIEITALAEQRSRIHVLWPGRGDMSATVRAWAGGAKGCRPT